MEKGTTTRPPPVEGLLRQHRLVTTLLSKQHIRKWVHVTPTYCFQFVDELGVVDQSHIPMRDPAAARAYAKRLANLLAKRDVPSRRVRLVLVVNEKGHVIFRTPVLV